MADEKRENKRVENCGLLPNFIEQCIKVWRSGVKSAENEGILKDQ
jgi:hypothetical protein